MDLDLAAAFLSKKFDNAIGAARGETKDRTPFASFVYKKILIGIRVFN